MDCTEAPHGDCLLGLDACPGRRLRAICPRVKAGDRSHADQARRWAEGGGPTIPETPRFDPEAVRAALACPDRIKGEDGCQCGTCARDGRRVTLPDCLACAAAGGLMPPASP